MEAPAELDVLSDTKPEGLCEECLCCTDADFFLSFFFFKSACPSAPSCFLEPPAGMSHEAVQCHRKFRHPEGDHFTLINIYNAFRQSQRKPRELLKQNKNKKQTYVQIIADEENLVNL